MGVGGSSSGSGGCRGSGSGTGMPTNSRSQPASIYFEGGFLLWLSIALRSISRPLTCCRSTGTLLQPRGLDGRYNIERLGLFTQRLKGVSSCLVTVVVCWVTNWPVVGCVVVVATGTN